jgi:hypothetical protein
MDHALAFDASRGTTVLFGGWDGQAPLGDTWEWDGTAWTNLTTATAPSARCCPAMGFDYVRSELVLFGGGQGTTNVAWNDTWVFVGGTWTQRSPGTAPSPRLCARMAFDPVGRSMLLFGGVSASSFLGDTWSWDGVTWTPRSTPVSPSPRGRYAMAGDLQHKIVLFGGFALGPSLNDTWIWDGSVWSQLATTVAPPPLSAPALAEDLAHGGFVLVGGGTFANRTWLLIDGTWRPDPRAIQPPADFGAGLASDIFRGRVVSFGGAPVNGPYSDATWDYDAGTLATWTPFGSGCAGSAGTPVLRAVGGSLPVIGSTFTLELASLSTSVAAFVVGLDSQLWNGHVLPFDLGTLGMPGCSLLVRPDASCIVTATAGQATLSMPLPNQPALIGLQFFGQGLALDPATNALGAVVSDAGVGVVGPF